MAKSKYLKILGMVLMIELAAELAWADNGAGTCGFTLLKIGMDARSGALGEATTAVVDDATSTYWNPAGLTKVLSHELTGTYLNYIAGIQSGYFGYALPFGENSGFGIGITYLDYGRIQETTPDNPTGEGLDEYGASDFAVSLGYGRKLGQINLGLALKGVYSRIHDYSAHALICDLGSQYELPIKDLSAGIAVRNLGIQTGAFIEEKAKLPLNIELGFGYRLLERSLLLALDVGKPLDNRFNYEIGIEYLFREILSLRFGYRSLGQDLRSGSDFDIFTGVSGGLGIKVKDYNIDYTFIPFNDLGNTHRISFSMGFALGRGCG